ncbi:Protein Y57A10A.10 [Aphelenchoides avenae]|nr:Protein Y57A10A.10 [Aphelenchus avenae]
MRFSLAKNTSAMQLSSFKVDQEVLLAAGSSVQRLKMYPYFDIAHYILMVATVREELGTNSATFSRRHPLSCWLSSMVVCFAGSLLANFLLGEPVIATFKKHDDILLATIVWYLVFYSPFDLVYKVSKILPVKIVLCILKETQRAYKIHHGVAYAAKLYPNAYLIHAIVGTSKGAGSGIIRVFEQLLRGVWVPGNNEILKPSFTTKACVIAAVIFTLDKNAIYINLPHEITYLGIVLFFVYFKLSAVLLHVTDPLAPFENLFCAIFMGGIWDALSRAIVTSRERRSANGKVENGTVPSDKKEQ